MIPTYLTDYPNMATAFPYFMKLQRLMHIPPHRHDFLELSLVVEGQGVQTINGHQHRMKPGTLIFQLPYQFHKIDADPEQPLLIYICNFDMKILYPAQEAFPEIPALLFPEQEEQLPYVQLSERDFAAVRPLFDTMMREYEERKAWSNVLIKAKLMEALSVFDRQREELVCEEAQFTPNPRPSIWQVIYYVQQNYRDSFSLSELAQQFHFNESHLSELFKKHAGKNFVHFLHEVRIRHACSLLFSTDMPITDIALEVGFGSFSSFSRIFKRVKGVTPQSFRKVRQA